jgi:hypothetical protein
MARTCPDGHRSESEDYCDVCGLALDGDAAAGTPEPAEEEPTAPDLPPVRTSGQECPNCAATNPADALFCEACGYDYTTGTMPRPAPLLSILDLDAPVPGGEGAQTASGAGGQPAASGQREAPASQGTSSDDLQQPGDSQQPGDAGPTPAPSTDTMALSVDSSVPAP